MIELKNISKKYGNKKVVDNVSLSIEEGKITSFIGPNGAGKSTLLSIMSRLIDDSEGEVLIDSIPIKSWNNNELSKRISILKQDNNINMKLTVKELVSFGRFPYSKGRLSEKDIDIIERSLVYMNLKEIENKNINELSGGQKQRAFIAMVVAQDTDLILLDEPLNNLDMKNSVEIMKLLKKLVRDFNKTIVIVIHDINFASAYSDNILAMSDGKLKYYGENKDIIKKEILNDLFKINFCVHDIAGERICTYYDSIAN